MGYDPRGGENASKNSSLVDQDVDSRYAIPSEDTPNDLPVNEELEIVPDTETETAEFNSYDADGYKQFDAAHEELETITNHVAEHAPPEIEPVPSDEHRHEAWGDNDGRGDGSIKYHDWPPWQKEWDSNHGAYYYYNIWTNETTWIQPNDYYEVDSSVPRQNRSAMPDGLILLKATKRIQNMYRGKVARRTLEAQKQLKKLITSLEIYDDRCDLWLERGILEFNKNDYNSAAVSLACAVSNIHIDSGQKAEDSIEDKVAERRRRQRAQRSEFRSLSYKKPERSESSKALQRFNRRLKTLPYSSKINIGKALRLLGLSLFYIWEESCDPHDLKHAWGALLTANTFFENLTNPEFMFAIAKCHAANGSFQGALVMLGKIIENASTWWRVDEVICVSAALLKHVKKREQAKKYFTYILESPFSKRKPYTLFLIQFQLSHLYLLENEADAAETGFQESLRLFRALKSNYDDDDQQKEVWQGEEYDPGDMDCYDWVGHPRTWFQIGRWLKALGLHVLSAEAFNEALLRLLPEEQKNPYLWYEVAQAANRCGDVEAATQWGHAALEMSPYVCGFSEKVRIHLVSWNPKYRSKVEPLDKAAVIIQTMVRRVQGRFHYLRIKHACRVLQRSVRIWLFWKHKREAEEKAQRLLQKFIKRQAVAALNKWHDFTMTMVKVRKLIGRRIGGFLRTVVFEWRKLARTNAAIRNRRHNAANSIQKSYRAYCCRTALARARKQKEELEARARLQLRRFILRRAVKVLNSWQAYVFQCRKVKALMRRVLNGTKKRFLHYWIEDWEIIMAHKNGCATTIQAEARRMLAQILLVKKRERDAAARVIQNRWRVRQSSILIRMMRLAMDKRIVDCSIRVQAAWRAKMSRRYIEHLHASATKIQKRFRGIEGRKISKRKRAIKRTKCSRKIQRVWRGYIKKKKTSRVQMDAAAIRLQACFRRFTHRHLLTTMMERTKKYWAKIVINNTINDVPIGPLTRRAIEDGRGNLVDKIWERYPCESIGKTQHAAEKDIEKARENGTRVSKRHAKKYSSISSRLTPASTQNPPKNILPLQKCTGSFYVSSIPEIKSDVTDGRLSRGKQPLPPLVRTPNRKVIYNPHALLKANDRIHNEEAMSIRKQMKKIKKSLRKRKRKDAQRHDLFRTHDHVRRRLNADKFTLNRLLSM